MNSNNDKIKIALLAVIALTLIVQTFYLVNDGGIALPSSGNEANAQPVSNMVADNAVESTIPPTAEPAAQSATRAKTAVKFEGTEHDFGKINQETENKKVFKFTNTGTEPLVIENAVGSCGCTVPEYPKEPILPGKTGEIVVNYKPGQQKGQQTKTVTITANTEPLTTLLYIKADVQEVKGSNPKN